ncbi:MAG: hypothetical protein H8E57_06875 [Candidatus Cloacimonetes bacterium]|nr:hypothetical protein [Candidatus Cloacimonadota bacterium]
MNDLPIRRQKSIFYQKLFVIILLIIALDYLFGLVLSHLFFSQKSGLNYRTTFVLENTKAEVVILGSSRANHHYKPQIFSDKFKLTCYNAGRDGQHIPFQYAMLKGIIKRYSPKILILDILPRQLLNNPENYRLNALLPYYKAHKEIRSVANLNSKTEKIKLLSKIYPFNSLLLTMIKSNLKKRKHTDGYIPLEKVMNYTPEKEEEEVKSSNDFTSKIVIDEKIVSILESFIALAKESGIEVYLVTSPFFKSTVNPKANFALEQIAVNNKVPFFDYSTHKDFVGHPELFQDNSHLNDSGAEHFSKIISMRIFDELKPKDK